MDRIRHACSKLKLYECFLKLFGIFPLENDMVGWRIYSMFLLVFIVWSFCYEMYGRACTSFIHKLGTTPRSVFIGTMNTVTDLFCNIIITISVTFFQGKFRTSMMKEFEKIDSVITNQKVGYPYVYFVSIHILYLVLILNELSMGFPKSKEGFFGFYAFDQLYRYRVSLTVLHINYLIKELLQRSKSINEILINAFEETILHHQDSNRLRPLENVVNDVLESYTSVVQLISHFNHLFGWQILAIFFNYILLFMVTYECGLKIIDPIVECIDVQMYIWFFCSITYSVFGAILVTSICHRTSKEARKTADLSYFYYYNLNISEYNYGQETLARYMLTLIRQTRNSMTTFSAAGFFPIDYSTLFILMNLLISYLIVLIQFE